VMMTSLFRDSEVAIGDFHMLQLSVEIAKVDWDRTGFAYSLLHL